MNEANARMIMGMLAAQTQTMFTQTFLNIIGLANIERTIRRLKDINKKEPFGRLRAFDFA